MLFGRPVNLWVGLIGAAVGTAITVISATQPAEVAQQWSVILGAVGGFLGVLVAFIAGQPPTVNTGDKINVITPAGEPNKTIAV